MAEGDTLEATVNVGGETRQIDLEIPDGRTAEGFADLVMKGLKDEEWLKVGQGELEWVRRRDIVMLRIPSQPTVSFGDDY